MKVELLVSEWCSACKQAEQVWQQVAAEKEIEFAVLDMAQPEGRELVSRLRLKTVPALVIDGELRGAGVQTPAQAREWTASAPPRRQAAVQNAGLLLSLDNRLFILGAVLCLMAGGSGLVINGSLLSDGPARPVAMHLVTIGFMLMLLYGLGAHMLPRFMSRPIRNGVWPWLQMGLVQLGLLGYVVGFWTARPVLVIAGGGLVWLSLAIFTWRLWPVLWFAPDTTETRPGHS